MMMGKLPCVRRREVKLSVVANHFEGSKSGFGPAVSGEKITTYSQIFEEAQGHERMISK